MNFLTALMMTTLFVTSAHADIKTEKQSVDTACAQDAATANCGSAQVGTGLLKCLHAYKKANKSFQYSATCKTAIESFEGDKKAAKTQAPAAPQ